MSTQQNELEISNPLSNLNSVFYKDKQINILHLNVRSLLPKIDEIRYILLNCKVHVFAVNEAWLENSVTDEEIFVDGYSIFRNDRKVAMEVAWHYMSVMN